MSAVVRLEPFGPDYYSLLRSWIAAPADLRIWAGTAFVWPLDEPQLAAYAAESGRHTWMGIDPETGEPVAPRLPATAAR